MKNEWTGERLETYIFNETTFEHLHRYAIVLEMVKDKNVLDIACGEGYGTNILSKKAKHITGVDIDQPTIEKAKNKYKSTNIEFVCSSALHTPFPDNNFELITCFETIEHLDNHSSFIKELKRILRPDGVLIISTPEKSVYSDLPGYKNPFHIKELYGHEFKSLIRSYFNNSSFFTQYSFTGSVVQKEEPENFSTFYKGDYTGIEQSGNLLHCYWIAVAADTEIPVLASSIFQSSKLLSQIQFEETEKCKKTITYRTGHILLYPLKFLKSLFKI